MSVFNAKTNTNQSMRRVAALGTNSFTNKL